MLYNLMEKSTNTLRRESEQSNCILLKNRLELVLSTLQRQRQHYDEEHRQIITRLQRQIAEKNQIILTLRKDLRNTNKQLEQSEKEADKYRLIIAQLKLEFFKMGKVVSKINTHFDFRAPKDTELTKVKSQGSIERPQAIPSFDFHISPVKTIKFDINGYFKCVKELKAPNTQRFCLEEKRSIDSKNTDDQSVKESLGQQATQTTEFKDLLNNELGIYTKLKDGKTSLKSNESPVKKFPKSHLGWCKQNTWHANQ